MLLIGCLSKKALSFRKVILFVLKLGTKCPLLFFPLCCRQICALSEIMRAAVQLFMALFALLCIHHRVGAELESQFRQQLLPVTRQLLGVDAWATARPCMAAPHGENGHPDSYGEFQ
jgi:hypothetical protein